MVGILIDTYFPATKQHKKLTIHIIYDIVDNKKSGNSFTALYIYV